MIGGGYYHVLAWPASRTGEPILLFWDLSHGRLKSSFVKPYMTRRIITAPGGKHEPGTLVDARIIRTSAPLMQVIRAMDRYSKTASNSDQPVEPWQILHHGTEVTQTYLVEKRTLFGMSWSVAALLTVTVISLFVALVVL